MEQNKTNTNDVFLVITKDFNSIDDPRVDRNKIYPLINIVFIVFCGTLAGLSSWEEFHDFSISRLNFFKKILDFSSGVPSASTIRRVFCLLDPQQFQKCFLTWVNLIDKHCQSEVVAIDGKALKSIYNDSTGKSPMHFMHAWATDQNILLAQRKFKELSQEPVEAISLLDMFDIKNRTITADAVFCTTKILEKIKRKEGNYLIRVKANRGILYKNIVENFIENDTVEKYAMTEEKNKGRQEKREISIIAPNSKIKKNKQWTGLSWLIKIKRQRECNGKTESEIGYYITDLHESPEKILEKIRKHWYIENKLHWELDVVMEEDGSRIVEENGRENLATIKRWALILLKREPSKKSMKRKQKMASWDEDFLAKLLLCLHH
jgi:predicted transposase YbfD/YdcC